MTYCVRKIIIHGVTTAPFIRNPLFCSLSTKCDIFKTSIDMSLYFLNIPMLLLYKIIGIGSSDAEMPFDGVGSVAAFDDTVFEGDKAIINLTIGVDVLYSIFYLHSCKPCSPS